MIKTIAIIVVMLAANALMIVSIRRSAVRIDYSLRRHFALKLTNEFLMDEADKKTADAAVCEETKDIDSLLSEAPQIIKEYILSNQDVIQQTPYKNGRMSEDYKLIKTVSKYSPEYALKCAKDILEKSGSGLTLTDDYKKALGELDFDSVCELNTLESAQQEQIIRGCIGDDKGYIVDDFLGESDRSFSSIDFYDYLKEMSRIYSQGFSVVSGSSELGGTKLGDGSFVEYDESIIEGSKVIHGNVVYDFSI